MLNDLDTVQQTLTTTVYFCHIAAKEKVRWQQILLPTTQVAAIETSGAVWDTSANLLTLVWNEFPRQDTFTYSFTVKFTNQIPFSFYWGKGALLFVNTNGVIEKITTCPQQIQKTINNDEDLSSLDTIYYIQVGVGSNHRSGDYRLLDDDKIFTIKYKNAYKYQVGPYANIEQAREGLLFYRKQVPDAFIVKEVKN